MRRLETYFSKTHVPPSLEERQERAQSDNEAESVNVRIEPEVEENVIEPEVEENVSDNVNETEPAEAKKRKVQQQHWDMTGQLSQCTVSIASSSLRVLPVLLN